MENNSTITLAAGTVAETTKLKTYFDGILAAEKSGTEFPVNLDHVWRIGYSRKDNAVANLRKNFLEGVDYQSSLQVQEREIGATTVEIFTLSVSCAEYFVVRSNREVFDVYRKCRRAVQAMVTTPALPNFSDPVAAARAWADAEEGKRQLQQQLQIEMQKKEQARIENQRLLQVASQAEEQLHQANEVIVAQAPAVELVAALTTAKDTLTLEEAAKTLNVPGIGRTKLIEAMKAKGILLQSTGLPAARYQASFPVKQTVFESPNGRTFTKSQVLVATVKGMAILRKMLS